MDIASSFVPRDVLTHIFDKLPIPDQMRCKRVCKDFLRAVRTVPLPPPYKPVEGVALSCIALCGSIRERLEWFQDIVSLPEGHRETIRYAGTFCDVVKDIVEPLPNSKHSVYTLHVNPDDNWYADVHRWRDSVRTSLRWDSRWKAERGGRCKCNPYPPVALFKTRRNLDGILQIEIL